MIAFGTAPQSTSTRMRAANSSSCIICRVPANAACFASLLILSPSA